MDKYNVSHRFVHLLLANRLCDKVKWVILNRNPERVIHKIYMDKMPGHTEHTQCFVYPNCIHPTATSCIGCPNIIPKIFLLISIGIELQKGSLF